MMHRLFIALALALLAAVPGDAARAAAQSAPQSDAQAAPAAAKPAATGAQTVPAAGQPAPPATKPAQAANAPDAAQTPTFPAQVEQVIVDVVVVDKKGNPLATLKAEDFTVNEDGVPQQVTRFEAIALPSTPTPTPAEPPRVTTNTDPTEQRGRTFAVVFDDTHMTPARANQAKAAVASFLEKGTRDGDRVTVVSTAGALWWTSRMPYGRASLLDMVKRLDGRYIPDMAPDRMSDYEAMRIHQYRDPVVAERVLRRWEQYGVQTMSSSNNSGAQTMSVGTVDDPMLTGRASEVYFQAAARVRATLEVLERVLNGLATAKGRKSVILVSEGFIYDTNLDDYRRVNQASRRANAAIYFLNSRGLEGMPDYMTAQFGPAIPDQDVGAMFTETLDAVAGADGVASDSGGFTVRNTNDLNQGIQRIATETQAYYLLGYTPSNTTRDGKFRKIQVKLAASAAAGKGLQVRARKGYFAPSDSPRAAEGKKGVDPVLQSALDSPWAQDEIPLRMTHFVGEEKGLGKAAVVVATDVDVRALEFELKDGRNYADLQFLLVVAHRESGEYFRYDQSVDMKLLPATRQRLSWQWYPIAREFELRPGEYQAKIVVRDLRSRLVGTVMHEFVVPPLDSFRVATPVLSDTRLPASNNTPGLPAMSARREFVQGADLFCAFEVYGAKTDGKDGMPRVIQGYEVRAPDGSLFTGIQPTPIKPTSLGQLSRMFGFKLADAPVGNYDIVMSVRDDIAGATLQQHEPFTVIAPSAAALPVTAKPTAGAVASTPAAAEPPASGAAAPAGAAPGSGAATPTTTAPSPGEPKKP
jgi:VWFA-related protein